MKYAVLDIGGTAIKSAVCENGTLSMIREAPTEAHLGGEHLAARVEAIISAYLELTPLEGIGISTAGQVDPVRGRIIYANQNIPGYTGMEWKDRLEKRFRIPTAVENDVNAAALGEAVYGAGKGEKDFICLTYGTGIGGALFFDGSLYRGSSCSAGEFGAIITHPEDHCPESDFFSGCYEKYASATALVKSAMAFDPSLTNGRKIFERIEEPPVRRLLDAWILEIIYGLISITHTLNPSCIILGGGIMEQPLVLEGVSERLFAHIMPSFRHIKIRKALLGNHAGLLGASVLPGGKEGHFVR